MHASCLLLILAWRLVVVVGGRRPAAGRDARRTTQPASQPATTKGRMHKMSDAARIKSSCFNDISLPPIAIIQKLANHHLLLG